MGTRRWLIMRRRAVVALCRVQEPPTSRDRDAAPSSEGGEATLDSGGDIDSGRRKVSVAYRRQQEKAASPSLFAHRPLSKLQRSHRHRSPPPRFIHRQHISKVHNTAPQLYQCFSSTSSGILSLRRLSGRPALTGAFLPRFHRFHIVFPSTSPPLLGTRP